MRANGSWCGAQVRLIGLLALVGMAGCSVAISDDEARTTNAGRIVDCTDTRDGEAFTYRGDTVSNVSIGLGGSDSCFDAVDEANKRRTLCKSHESWLKCAVRQ